MDIKCAVLGKKKNTTSTKPFINAPEMAVLNIWDNVFENERSEIVEDSF